MLYKVTPKLTPEVDAAPVKEAKPVVEGEVAASAEPQAKIARKRRKALVYDAEGHEVLITMMCLKCKSMKPLAMFGLRKMADGAVRNQPWCRNCRSGASASKKKDAVEAPAGEATAAVHAAAPSAPAVAPSQTQTDMSAVIPAADAVALG